MNTKLIILEGPDNTGKTTLINRIIKVFELQNKNRKTPITYKAIHMSKPPKDIKDNNEANLYQQQIYIDTLDQIKALNYEVDYIFVDRAWLSEYVYGQLYRNRNALEIIENNIYIEQEILNEFDTKNVYMFLLIGTVDFLVSHDDGKSLSSNNRFLIGNELKLFKKGFDLSIIPYKTIYDINEHNEYTDILPLIYSYITCTWD